MSTNNIKFIGVARGGGEKVVVASYVVKKDDYNAEQYYGALNEVLGTKDFKSKVIPGSRYRLVGDINAFNFMADSQYMIYAVITTKEYPERVIFQMILNEFMPKFKAEFGEKSRTASPNALDKPSLRLLQRLVEDYENPGRKDKLAEVHRSVDDVKNKVQDSITGMFNNLAVTEKIGQDTQRLQESAAIFDRQATQLKHMERCKNYKVTAVLLIAVIIVIIVLVTQFLPKNTGGSSPAPATTSSPTTTP